ncbi:MAG: alkaline phosphatase family protein, partial [Solirubrobacteraceae bacterium]
PLPAGTQPNRLMAMSGVTTIDTNRTILPPQELVYDWLTKRGVTWRVYHQGLPFFTLMTKWIPEMLGSNHFRPFLALEEDLNNTPPDDMPQVLFIEPTYTDAPHLGRSTDDHAPSGVSDGQEFLMQAYNAVTTSLDFWRGALMIVTYDEHGGFFDHVAPPPIATNPPRPGLYPPLHSLGVRVPAYVVSPFVRPGAVSHLLFDHTSILKFLGERFGQGSYSAVVDVRPVKSVAEVLESNAVTSPPPAAPALHDYLSLRPSVPTATVPNNGTPLEKGFQHAVGEMRRQGADQNHPKFGPLLKQINQLPSPGSAGSGS